MKKEKILLRVFILIIIILIIVGMFMFFKSKRDKNIEISNKPLNIQIDNELLLGITDFDTLNPILSKNKDVQYISKLIFNSLLKINRDFKLENDLIKEYNMVDDKTYIIKLKDNILWHDNKEFISKDVIYTVKTIKENKNSLFYKNIEDIEEIYELDDLTIKIKLRESNSFFNYLLTFPIISAHNKDENMIIGTGEYKVFEIGDSEILLYTENIEYNIKKIKIKIYDSVSEIYSAFSKEKIDLIVTENIEYDKILGTIGYNVNKNYGRKFSYIAINNNHEILRQSEVRKALYYFINTKNIIYNVYFNKYIEANTTFDYIDWLKKEKNDKSEKQGKEILIENDWYYNGENWEKDGQKLSFTLLINKNDSKQKQVAKEIYEQLLVKGIHIEIIELRKEEIQYRIENKDYELILIETLSTLKPNVNTYYGENNIFNYKDEETLENIETIKNITNEEVLKEKYDEIFDKYIENIPFLNLYYNCSFVLNNEALKGEISNNWNNIFYNIEKWYKIKI